MSLSSAPYPAARPRLLLCLDLQLPVTACDAPAVEPQACVANCRSLLAQARGAGWSVAHVHAARRPGDPRLRPMPGLAPLPAEPVFTRPGVSAFSSRPFREFIRTLEHVELVIIGFSITSSCLATALAAFDWGLPATLVEDAVSASPLEAKGLQAMESLARSIAAPFVRLAPTSGMVDRRPELRVIEGGHRPDLATAFQHQGFSEPASAGEDYSV